MSIEVADLAKRATEAKVAVIEALGNQYTQLCSALQETTFLQMRLTLEIIDIKCD